MRIKFFLLSMLFSVFTYAQKTELLVNVNSGLLHFNGTDASANSAVIYNPVYTNLYPTMYGTKSDGPGLGMSASLQHITKYNWIYGLEGGYEHFASKNEITEGLYGNSYSSSYNDIPVPMRVSGKYTTTFNYINLHPYTGFRFSYKQINIDLTAGLDIAFVATYKGHIKVDTDLAGHIDTATHIMKPKTDFRPRLQLNISYKKVGIYAGYSWGARNYLEDVTGTAMEAKARIFRFGASYRLL